MKKALLALSLVFALSARSQTTFPTITGVNLDGKRVSLPTSNGKFTIVGIAFHRGAEDDLRRWLKPLYETFVKAEANAGGMSSADVHDVNFYFVPAISGVKNLSDDFKNGTDKELWPYIIDTDKTDLKALQKAVGAEDNKIPYFFVVNKEGKIIETQSGVFNPAKIDKLEDAVE